MILRIFLFILFANLLCAQPSYLVKNINQGPIWSEIELMNEIAKAGDFLYISGGSCTESPELYTVDLQADSMYLSKNTWADRSWWGDNRWCGSDPIFYFSRAKQLTPVGSYLYYTIPHLDYGSEIWRTDGTYEGTSICADIAPGTASSNPVLLTAFNDELWFMAHHPDYGMELWRTDATTGNAELFMDMSPGIDSSSVGNLFALNEWLYFTMKPVGQGYALWRTNGTVLGTTEVLQMDSITFQGAAPTAIWGIDSNLFIISKKTGSPIQLHRLNISNFDVELIHDNYPTYASTFIKFNDRIFFQGLSPENGKEMWVTDGTWAGTSLFFDAYVGPSNGTPYEFTILGDQLYFIAQNTNSNKLYRTDGTINGTVEVTESIYSGWNKFILAAWNGYIWFSRNNGQELWRTDGITTEKMLDGFNEIFRCYPFGNSLYLVARIDYVKSVFKYDGTPNGELQIMKGFQTTERWSDPSYFSHMSGNTYFWANDTTGYRNIWRTNGNSSANTYSITTPPQQYFNTADERPYVINDSLLVYSKKTLPYGRELWRSNGEANSEELIKDLAPGTLDGIKSSIYGSDGKYVYFGRQSNKLYRSDGTSGGTTLLKDSIDDCEGWVKYNDKFCGLCWYQSATWVLITDGTVSGTELVTKIFDSSYGGWFTIGVFNSKFYFFKESVNGGWSLYESNGTIAGTQSVLDNLGGSDYDVSRLAANDVGLFFVLRDSSNLQSLFYYDTSNPPLKLTDFAFSPYYDGSVSNATRALKGKIIFNKSDIAHGSELWVSDGTVQGTQLLKDIMPGAESSFPAINVGVEMDSAFYFNAFTDTHGAELWRTDGTSEGTYMVQDICPGSCSSNPTNLSPMPDGSLYFSANSPGNGFEPWVYYPDGISSAKPVLQVIPLDNFTVYPNPASDMLTIERIDASHSCQALLIDYMGRTRFSMTIIAGATQISTTLNHLENGFYYLIMRDNLGELLTVKKIVVNKL